MVVILTDQPNTRLRGTPRQIASSPRNCHRWPARPTLPAAVLATVKGISLPDGVRLRAAAKVRSAPQEIVASWSNEEIKKIKN
jgi:hypothetical protein